MRKTFRDLGCHTVGGDSTAWTGWSVPVTPENNPGLSENYVNIIQDSQTHARKLLHLKSPQSKLQTNFLRFFTEQIQNSLHFQDACISRSPHNDQLFSVVKPFDELLSKYPSRFRLKQGISVNKLIREGTNIVLLETSKDDIDCSSSKVIIAGGCFGTTELLLQSFGESEAGKQLGAHFVLRRTLVAIPAEKLKEKLDTSELELAQYHITVPNNQDLGKAHIQMRVLTVPPGCCEIPERPDIPSAFYMWKRKQNDEKAYVLASLTGLGELEEAGNTCTLQDNKLVVTVNATAKDRELHKYLEDTVENLIKGMVEDSNGISYCTDNTWCDSFTHGEIDFLTHPTSSYSIGKVVDDKYNYIGTQNLYLTGTGLWPSAGSLNPTLLIVAMAIHLATILFGETATQTKPEKLTGKEFLRSSQGS